MVRPYDFCGNKKGLVDIKEKGEDHMNKKIDLSLDNEDQLSLIGKALSSEVRIALLKLLCQYELNVNEIAERLQIPASSAAMNVKVLEEAGLIETHLMPGVRGSMKVCHKTVDQIDILLLSNDIGTENSEIIRMPIGNYVDYKVEPTCGIVSEKGPIDEEDEPRCFYSPERGSAKLIWFSNGYLEYRFPNTILKTKQEKSLEISMELCSEDHEYNMDCPSDITLWVNEMEAGTWTCPSDFGGRRGKLNPSWWPDKNTQYGKLKTWRITEEGSFLDGVKCSEACIQDYHLGENDYIAVKIGTKEDAVNQGGVNLFGDCFGDHAQNIILKIGF